MFEIKTTYLDNNTQIKFPCDGYHLYSNMDKLHIPDSEKPTVQLFINEINYEELKCLEDQFVDPDVLNFLAQRLDSFDKNERKKFDAVVRTFNIDNPRELVNLTFNMHYYTLIDDMSDMEKVGKTHMLTRKQVLSVDNSEGYDFYNIGQKLMESETGRLTQYGIIFVNDDLPYEKPYVSNNLPNFEYDANKILTLKLQHEESTAYVHLPDSQFVIARAVNRIGADNDCVCEVTVENMHSDAENYKSIFESIIENESIYDLNNLTKELDKLYDWQLKKLRAVIDYAEVSDSENIGILAQNLNCFIIYDDVKNNKELAYEYLENHSAHYMNTDLKEYFDYDGYGEHLKNYFKGKYVDGMGFVGMLEECKLEEILGQDEDRDFTMQM